MENEKKTKEIFDGVHIFGVSKSLPNAFDYFFSTCDCDKIWFFWFLFHKMNSPLHTE